jgi:hypothetical protein
VNTRLSFPGQFLQATKGFLVRIDYIRVLKYILNNIDLNEYDQVVFLSYDTLSMALLWPENRSCFIFEHNNVDNSRTNIIKKLIYKIISKSCSSLVLYPYIGYYVARETKRVTHCVPVPILESMGESVNSNLQKEPVSRDENNLTIFSPSGNTQNDIIIQLEKFVNSENSRFKAICKGQSDRVNINFSQKTFFINYNEIMLSSDYILIGMRLDYRGSGVLHEALSLGKLVVMFDCLHANEMLKNFPGLITVINRVEDIGNIKIDPPCVSRSYEKFKKDHSKESINGILKNTFNSTNIKSIG